MCLECVEIERRLAGESVDLRILESGHQRLTRSVRPQTRNSERTSSIDGVPEIKIPVLSEESTHPSLDAAVVEDDFACYRIKALARLHRVFLDKVAKCKHGGKAVSELHEAYRCCHAGEAEEVGDRGSEDERDGPVDWNNTGPEDLAAFRDK